MKKSILLIAFSLFSLCMFAQQELVLQKNAKGFYVAHTVTPQENFYSIGRKFNVPAKEIAAFNGLDMSHGLNIGQVINIPLNNANYSNEKSQGVPVYHVVSKGETLAKVSSASDKVSLQQLREWNGLAEDLLNAGQKLVVGFITSGEMAAAAPAFKKPTPAAPPAPKEAKQITEEVMPPAKEEVVEVKKEEPVVMAKKEEVKPVEETPQPKPAPVKTAAKANNNTQGGTGFFKSQFQLQLKVQPLSTDETVAAGIFKTASGWQDAKYYALMDNVDPGTIIKIENPNNNKAIYAKVLDKVSGIRQNDGYDLRMSNAAAIALDIADTDKFFVRVIY